MRLCTALFGLLGSIPQVSLGQDPFWEIAGSVDTAVTAMIVNPSGVLYIGTLGEGVLKSTDQGTSWIPCGTDLPGTWITDLAASPDGTVFAAVFLHGFFRSINAGSTWEMVSEGIPDPESIC